MFCNEDTTYWEDDLIGNTGKGEIEGGEGCVGCTEYFLSSGFLGRGLLSEEMREFRKIEFGNVILF